MQYLSATSIHSMLNSIMVFTRVLNVCVPYPMNEQNDFGECHSVYEDVT